MDIYKESFNTVSNQSISKSKQKINSKLQNTKIKSGWSNHLTADNNKYSFQP